MQNLASDFNVSVQLVGGPTLIIEIGGLRLVTDPTFDPPGIYDVGGRHLQKTTGPALLPEAIGLVDAVLLSHDQHVDNWDRSGREWTSTIQKVLTTPSASQRIDGATALAPWNYVDLERPNGGVLRVTGVPAQHGPDNTEHLVGEVIGFVLSGESLPTVYVSGDNASLSVVQAIAQRVSSIDIAVIFCGAAQTPLLGHNNLTLGSEEVAMAAQILQPKVVIPAHFEGWAHYTQGEESVRKSFESSQLQNGLHLLKPGQRVTL